MLARAISAAVAIITVLALFPSTIAVAEPAHPASFDQSVPAFVAPSSGSTAAAKRRLALGVAVLPASGAVYDDLSAVDAFTSSVERAPAIWTIWRDWLPRPWPNTRFPGKTLLDGLYNRHIVPMINWQPNDPNHTDENLVPFLSIIQGKFDTYIRSWARQAKAYGHPIIMRFAHEMDGAWMPWQVGKFGNSAKRFIAAWRHIVTVFRNVGATNVRWLWSPYHPTDWSVNFYPGDKYVDYVGFTGLNWADGKRPWQSMRALYAKPMHALAQFSKRPVIVAEAGTADRSINGVSRKPGWISAGYPAVYKAYPSIAAIVYFDVKVPGQTKYDWRLTRPSSALVAYSQILTDKRFQGFLH